MFQDLAPTAMDLLAQYGMVVLFLLLVLDNSGIPFPTELVLIMAVAMFVTDMFSLVLVIALATGAALVGSFILYGICFAGGRKLVEKKPKLFMMNPRRLDRLERVFSHKVGKSLVFFLRLFPLTRVLVSIPAGIARMKPMAFLVLTFFGMAIYHVVLVFIAYRFGSGSEGGPSIDAAVASPAWHYIQANQVFTFLALLLLGLLWSLKSSRSTFKDPEWSSPSKVGWVAERLAVFGGLALIVLALVDLELVYRVAAWGGLDLPVLMEQINWDAGSFIMGVGMLSLFLGFPILLYGRAARRRAWQAWEVEHGLRGTAEVFSKPRSATAAGERLQGGKAGVHTRTLRSQATRRPGPSGPASRQRRPVRDPRSMPSGPASRKRTRPARDKRDD